MTNSTQLVILALDEQRYALRLSAVGRIVRRVEISALPKAPEIVLGVINLQGRIIPVVNLRRRFRLPEPGARLSEQIVIADTARRTIALVVDAVLGVIAQAPEEVIAAEELLPGLEYVEGIVKLADGMVFIHDLDAFLSLDEEQVLDEALKMTE